MDGNWFIGAALGIIGWCLWELVKLLRQNNALLVRQNELLIEVRGTVESIRFYSERISETERQ